MAMRRFIYCVVLIIVVIYLAFMLYREADYYAKRPDRDRIRAHYKSLGY